MTLQLHDSAPDLGAPRWFRRAASYAAYANPYSAAAKFAWQNRKKIGSIAREAATTYNPYYRAAKFAWSRRPKFLREDMAQGYDQIFAELQETPTYYQFLQENGLSGNEPQEQLAGKFGTWIKTKAVPGLQKLQKNLAPVIGLLPGGGTINAAFDIVNRPKDGSLPGPPVEPIVQPMVPQQVTPPFAPQFAPPSQPMYPETSYAYAPPAPGGLPFGLDWKTLALLGLGGVVLYKTLKK